MTARCDVCERAYCDAAVRGGEGDLEWTGGEILERVELDVREVADDG